MVDEIITGDQSVRHREVTLASILNVLWRRKWIVILLTLGGFLAGLLYGRIVTPLYQASATIRPGITAYNPNGGPVREWKLKDLTHWFNIGMYRKSVAEQLGWTEYKWIDIKANFIMRGMQNIQGGNVITLTTLDPDPQQAMDILEAATLAFNEYARADSVSSQIGLTRSGLMIQIAALQNQQGLLQSKRAKLDLDIAVAKSESSQVETQMLLIDLEIERQTIAKDLYQRHLHTQAAESLTIAVRLRDLDAILGSGAGGSPDPEMVQAAIQLEMMKYRNQSRADSLRHLVALSGNKQTELGIKRDQELVAKKANLHREVEILRVERDGELPHEDVDLANQIWERRSKLAILAPIERVGHIQISSGPVRPRKTRAVSILTLVAFLGSLFAAFAWEYISSQREEIFRARGR